MSLDPPQARRRWWPRQDTGDVGSFRRQLILSTVALGAMVALALVVVVQIVLAGTTSNAVDRVLRDRAEAVVSSADAASTGSAVVVPDAQLDPGVAVYAADGSLVAGAVPQSLTAFFEEVSMVTSSTTQEATGAYQVLAEPFVTSGGARGVVVVAEPLGPYENDEHYALVVSLAAGAVIVLLATALAAWASKRALDPVGRMAATAEDWSAHDLDRRFDLGAPTNEIRALGHTLDGLLSRVASAIQAEQRLTSELAHELRTPLTAIKATADLMAMRPDLDDQLREDVADVQESCRVMAATVTSLLELARTQGIRSVGVGADLDEVLDDVVRGLEHLRLGQVSCEPTGLGVALPHDLAVRAISPIVQNALRFADHVVVRAEPTGERVTVIISDDGPGVASGLVGELFEPGRSSDGGSGLGLALARRVARSVGGEVSLLSTSTAGATFAVTLPTR